MIWAAISLAANTSPGEDTKIRNRCCVMPGTPSPNRYCFVDMEAQDRCFLPVGGRVGYDVGSTRQSSGRPPSLERQSLLYANRQLPAIRQNSVRCAGVARVSNR